MYPAAHSAGFERFLGSCAGISTASIICPMMPSQRIMTGFRYFCAVSKALCTISTASCSELGA